MLTFYKNLRMVSLHQYTGISIQWNVYNVLHIFFSYQFHPIVDTTVRVRSEAVNYSAL